MNRAIATMGLIVMFAFTAAAHAAIVIGGTRIVFPAQAHDVSLRIENKGNDPALAQVWIDDGDERSTPSNARAPFAIAPPLFRIDPGHGHALRIVHVGDDTPRDREALYWLNVLEIPPKADAAEGKNVLQLAFRHRLKLFHRPKDLAVAVDRAASTLTWSIVREAGSARLRVENPSAYHVSFNAVSLHGRDPGSAPVSLGGGMVKPGGSTSFPLPTAQTAIDGASVSFATINDFGAVVNATATLAP